MFDVRWTRRFTILESNVDLFPPFTYHYLNECDKWRWNGAGLEMVVVSADGVQVNTALFAPLSLQIGA